MAGETPTYTDPMAGANLGYSESLANWVGPYVTDMLGKGAALAQTPYTPYTGPLTAGTSPLQNQAFQGIASLSIPTAMQTTYNPTSYTDPGVAARYMSPYIQQALEPQLAEAQRQADIARVQQAGRLTQAGAYGGGRQAIMDSELTRNLLRNMADITGRGYQTAYEQGAGQFNTEEARRLAATQNAQGYGINVLKAMQDAGATQRGVTQEGVLADIAQFEQERDYPYKQIQYMQSLLQGLPVQAQITSYMQPSGLTQFLGGAGGILSLLGEDGLNWI